MSLVESHYIQPPTLYRLFVEGGRRLQERQFLWEDWEPHQKNYFTSFLTRILPAQPGIVCCQDSCREKKKKEEKSNFSKVNCYYLNEFDQVVEFGQRLSFLCRKSNMIAQYNEQVSSQCQSTQ